MSPKPIHLLVHGSGQLVPMEMIWIIAMTSQFLVQPFVLMAKLTQIVWILVIIHLLIMQMVLQEPLPAQLATLHSTSLLTQMGLGER